MHRPGLTCRVTVADSELAPQHLASSPTARQGALLLPMPTPSSGQRRPFAKTGSLQSNLCSTQTPELEAPTRSSSLPHLSVDVRADHEEAGGGGGGGGGRGHSTTPHQVNYESGLSSPMGVDAAGNLPSLLLLENARS
eukprot:1227889-Rhodomonas_salina.1